MRKRIFDYFARIRIEAADQVLIRGGVPNASLINCYGVRRCGRSGQGKFLERFSLWIESTNLVSRALAEPHDSVGIDGQALWRALGRRRPLRHLLRFCVDLSDLAIFLKYTEPDISILVAVGAVG